MNVLRKLLRSRKKHTKKTLRKRRVNRYQAESQFLQQQIKSLGALSGRGRSQ